jgi:hypothetical protein
MFFALVDTFVLFGICYVIGRAYLEVEENRRCTKREKAEQEHRERMAETRVRREAAIEALPPDARDILLRSSEGGTAYWYLSLTPEQIAEYASLRPLVNVRGHDF